MSMGIISDVHGNLPALESVLALFHDMEIETIVCLGDTSGYYTQINECCDLLRKHKVRAVMGNHDWYLVSGARTANSKSANRCLDFQREIISEENLSWLSSLPIHLKFSDVSMVHGGWRDPLHEYLEPNEHYFSDFEGVAFASGHTHKPGVWDWGTKKYLNPGSVGQPRDNNPAASFGTWDGEDFKLFRTPYNFTLTQNLMHNAGFPEYFYKGLSSGRPIGQ